MFKDLDSKHISLSIELYKEDDGHNIKIVGFNYVNTITKEFPLLPADKNKIKDLLIDILKEYEILPQDKKENE